jgi:curved DNA-binding protein CbpA
MGDIGDSFIDPYELLGVTIDTSPKEVKRAYYTLSLYLHPDKGGHANDMRILQNAYEYVYKQISGVNRSITIEDLQTQFKEFCDSQDAVKLQSFADIFNDGSFDLGKFNNAFEKDKDEIENKHTLLYEHGYGEFMEASEYVGQEDKPSFTMPSESNVEQFKQTTNVFHDYMEKYNPHSTSYMLINASSAKDYTSTHMTDYKVAYTDAEKMQEYVETNITFDEYVKTREVSEQSFKPKQATAWDSSLDG